MTKGRKPTDEEQNLWQQVMKGVRPLARKDVVIHKVLPPSKVSVRKKIEERQYKELYATFSVPKVTTLDSKLMPTGKVQLDGRIDLHGMTLAQAEDRLKHYLLHAQGSGKRWILVITGKGVPDNPDSLRHTVPRWLDQWSMIAGYRVAKPNDGGEGALYVWIKRDVK